LGLEIREPVTTISLSPIFWALPGAEREVRSRARPSFAKVLMCAS
jgi:hypothetical protein